MGALSDYELQPIIIVRSHNVTDDELQSALVEYVRMRVFEFVK